MASRGPLSPATRAAISEGLRRYRAAHGGSPGRGRGHVARTAAMRDAAGAYQGRRNLEHFVAGRSTRGDQSRAQAAATRQDRLVGTMGRLAQRSLDAQGRADAARQRLHDLRARRQPAPVRRQQPAGSARRRQTPPGSRRRAPGS